MKISPKAWPWIVLSGYALLLAVVSGLAFFCFPLFYTSITESLGIPRAQFSIVNAFSSIASGISSLIIIKLVKVVKPRIIAFVGGIAAAVAYLVLGLANGIFTVYMMGVLQGIAIIIAGMAMLQIGLLPWFEKKMGTAIGIAGTTVGLGTMLFSPMIGNLISHLGWRQTCFICAGIILVAAVIAFVFLIRDDPYAMGVLPYGLDTDAARAPDGDGVRIVSGTPIREALRSPKFYLMFFGIFLVGFSFHILSLDQSAMIQDKGFTLEQASYCLSVFAASNLINKFIVGAIQDRFGFRALCAYCAVGAIGAALCLLLGRSYAAMICFSALLGVWAPIIALYGMFSGDHLFGPKERVLWIILGQLGYSIGAFIGPLAASRIYAQAGSYTLRVYSLLISATLFFVLCMTLYSRRRKYRVK